MNNEHKDQNGMVGFSGFGDQNAQHYTNKNQDPSSKDQKIESLQEENRVRLHYASMPNISSENHISSEMNQNQKTEIHPEQLWPQKQDYTPLSTSKYSDGDEMGLQSNRSEWHDHLARKGMEQEISEKMIVPEETFAIKNVVPEEDVFVSEESEEKQTTKKQEIPLKNAIPSISQELSVNTSNVVKKNTIENTVVQTKEVPNQIEEGDVRFELPVEIEESIPAEVAEEETENTKRKAPVVAGWKKRAAYVSAFLVVITSISAYQFFHVDDGDIIFSSNIVNMMDIQRGAAFLEKAISEKDSDRILELMGDAEGKEGFLADVARLDVIEQLEVEALKSGIFVSFMATTQKSDVLHPYYGFFEKDKENITQVTWGGMGASEKISEEPTENEKYVAVRVKNTGKFPWSVDDTWENVLSKKKAILISSDKKKFVEIGREGVFVMQKSDQYMLKNREKGFLLPVK